MSRPMSAQPNPALEDLEFFTGAWNAEISNARFLPDPSARVRGTVLCEWIEGGDYLVMRQGTKAAGLPYATWLIGRDEAAQDYHVLYVDDRKASRVYGMSFDGSTWRLWREAPGFFQRFDGKVSGGGTSIRATWEISRDGADWEHDFDVTYTRAR